YRKSILVAITTNSQPRMEEDLYPASKRNARMKGADRITEILSKLGMPGPKGGGVQAFCIHYHRFGPIAHLFSKAPTAESFNPTSRIISR
ncbi:MAG TPA: hypothetical protein VHF65_09650, partial [Nitrososphaera sp.]|nr:hypothetical protein [Nitrososphaera sp.]